MGTLQSQLWQILLTYATAIDTKSFDLLNSLFHEDYHADHSPGPVFSSRHEVIEMMKRIHTPLFGSLHRLTNFSISIEDANTVLSSTYVDAILVGGTESDRIVYRDNGIYH